ncbi:anhydro-N-acetylmuramic acid kinase [Gloeocapsa sp. PCC 73106]|uniref:anhydro-N-acetylmuramic acid kinase n=1 Tax=Gloeocapsa sp. PCC 73106 TaxID=102232 RepID=UPI0002ACF360|nr:anhydro-N-acetylmuramic acid kinase [Gloeocapsa sp. PCC 73106]ELR99444.1 molecular chaperone [Gloeocapsa sp. PCC 73106]
MKVIGLMSGTSVDGIDAALVEIKGKNLNIEVSLLDSVMLPYPTSLATQILAVAGGCALSLADLASLDDAIAREFAAGAQYLAQKHADVALIGSHGQTVYHRPPGLSLPQQLGYTLQLGRGELIANLTGIPTVSNFRNPDIAAYGQGAPLVSKVDAALLTDMTKPRCIQNIGGIANLTYLPPQKEPNWLEKITGWDTGPGNVLLDLAVKQLTQGRKSFDRNGDWASQGQPAHELVADWLEQDFFRQSPPKSTGRELFGTEYLDRCAQRAQGLQLSAADWLATLTELTVGAIVNNYRAFLPQMPAEVILCGGGSNNLYLTKRLQAKLGEEITVLTTDTLGINSKFKEALAFAVLAYWRFDNHFPGNLPQVTGAKQEMLLGSIYLPSG